MLENQATALQKIAGDYFAFLARMFPVMCASDEFDAFPRAQAARHYDHTLDDFSVESVQDCLSNVRSFQKALQTLSCGGHDLECQIDKGLLQASMAGVVMELETKKTWRHNPLLYLKVAMIGLDHGLNKPVAGSKTHHERILSRLKSIPRLFKEAMGNLQAVPQAYHGAACSMIPDCKAYLKETAQHLVKNCARWSTDRFQKGWQEALASLDAFDRYCGSLEPTGDAHLPVGPILEDTLGNRFLCTRSLDEIREMAQDEWQKNLASLKAMEKESVPETSWQNRYLAYTPPGIRPETLLTGYRKEIRRLQDFFHDQGFGWFLRHMTLTLKETPTYLRSVRGSASFCSALSEGDGETDAFFITTRYGKNMNKEAAAQVAARLNKEYRFLAAHETIPGHHLLDSVRRTLENPIRRQIESPLFYEGWATYAETLLIEYGYVDSLPEKLIACKRRLWRAARCQIDVGINTGHLTEGNAIALLEDAGFSRQEAANQVRRYRLNPGYQLCYTLGLCELLRLKQRYGPMLGLDGFHQSVLQGGEIPFHLIAKRLEASDRGHADPPEG